MKLNKILDKIEFEHYINNENIIEYSYYILNNKSNFFSSCSTKNSHKDSTIKKIESYKNDPVTLVFDSITSYYNHGGNNLSINCRVQYGDSSFVVQVNPVQIEQAIMKYGIQPGGQIGGTWIFGLNGSNNIDLFLINGNEYNIAKNKKYIPTNQIKNNFIIGKTYVDKLAEFEFIYIGKMKPINLISPQEELMKKLNPEWYKQQNMNFELWHTPRFIFNSKDMQHFFLVKNPNNGNYSITTRTVVYETEPNDTEILSMTEIVSIIKNNLPLQKSINYTVCSYTSPSLNVNTYSNIDIATSIFLLGHDAAINKLVSEGYVISQ